MSDLPRLPLTVIGGYLGAGKTTLLNRLLAEDHGQRVMVMVNDFGAINIDADLIEKAEGDTISLTNGCVCCTMGNDLFMALGDALDRRPRPDHLVVEASGIADPAKIAMAARAEPEMAYGGIAVVVDAVNWPALADDPQIGAQMQGQAAVADMLLVSKATDGLPAGLEARLAALSPAPVVDLATVDAVAPLLLGGITPGAAQAPRRAHPGYVGWAHDGTEVLDRAALEALVAAAPEGVYRIKGKVLGPEGAHELHVVGRTVDIKPTTAARTTLVAIGLDGRVTQGDIADWWRDAVG
ncbi:GTP-binding protein [Lutimaribacter sp. EGI FJ00015]|uniref:GTP-binding protein n=1 Tax=Lutimaribacter degradans TaxID=2945989 RepID=A0ACC5ZZR1_9RHOB|nr:GTP-binding protein [Lutimaribacter sp. EGI FJ00013]MCM2563315.1 GTP-binding protein [Lutimaribacter sp. EGI FJ00013]MCO0614362.1 GTP-binding protein [Lutimaribacter sp. EGI FJ00015]MCO0636037.1 GTP-binding protein [Lutimaribacter sp. EGI FJ00014]